MKRCPIILSVAGSDCSGGAGIQADIKTISALGGYAASAITAITIQNTLGVQAVHILPSEIVCKQIEVVMDDLQPDAIKIGMVGNASIVHALANCIRKYKPRNVVYDPVMVSTSGRQLIAEDAILEIKKVLFPLTSLITPNLDEVMVITGKALYTTDEMTKVAQEISELYGTSVLIKGGHLTSNEMCDVLHVLGDDIYLYKGDKIESKNLHGTGCTLSSAIATYLATGYSMNEAVRQSKEYINGAIIAGKELNIGHGNGPLWHFF